MIVQSEPRLAAASRLRRREIASTAGNWFQQPRWWAGVLALGTLVGRWAAQWKSVYADLPGRRRIVLGGGVRDYTEQVSAHSQLLRCPLLSPLLLLFAAVTAAALLASAGQSGGVSFHANALAWKWERLSPPSNLKNLFSLRGLSRLLKSLLPAAILLAFCIHRIFAHTAVPPLGLEQLPGMLRTSYAIPARHGVDTLCLVGGRLSGGVEELGVASKDVEAGCPRRAENRPKAVPRYGAG